MAIKNDERLVFWGDPSTCAKWLPWARKRFRILDDGRLPTFSKVIPLVEVTIKLDRVGSQRKISILTKEIGGIVCIPTHVDVAPYGWGSPYTDEFGEPVNNGLGTLSDSNYQNSPYNIISTRGSIRRLTRRTEHAGEPWDISSPQAYGIVGCWSKDRDSVSWSNRQTGGVLYSWVFYKGKPAFYLEGDPDDNPVTVSAASVFGGRIIVVGHRMDAVNVYSLPRRGYTADQVQEIDFSEYLIASYSVGFGWSRAYVNPRGDRFVFVGPAGVSRVGVSVDALSNFQTTFSATEQEAPNTVTGVFAVEQSSVRTDLATHEEENDDTIYYEYEVHANRTVFLRDGDLVAKTQIGVIWVDSEEVPVFEEYRFSYIYTFAGYQYVNEILTAPSNRPASGTYEYGSSSHSTSREYFLERRVTAAGQVDKLVYRYAGETIITGSGKKWAGENPGDSSELSVSDSAVREIADIEISSDMGVRREQRRQDSYAFTATVSTPLNDDPVSTVEHFVNQNFDSSLVSGGVTVFSATSAETEIATGEDLIAHMDAKIGTSYSQEITGRTLYYGRPMLYFYDFECGMFYVRDANTDGRMISWNYTESGGIMWTPSWSGITSYGPEYAERPAYIDAGNIPGQVEIPDAFLSNRHVQRSGVTLYEGSHHKKYPGILVKEYSLPHTDPSSILSFDNVQDEDPEKYLSLTGVGATPETLLFLGLQDFVTEKIDLKYKSVI